MYELLMSVPRIITLQGKADPNKPNKVGRTPLHLACIEAYYDMVKILLDHGNMINVVDFSFKTL